jgi:hypothetical protein
MSWQMKLADEVQIVGIKQQRLGRSGQMEMLKM